MKNFFIKAAFMGILSQSSVAADNSIIVCPSTIDVSQLRHLIEVPLDPKSKNSIEFNGKRFKLHPRDHPFVSKFLKRETPALEFALTAADEAGPRHNHEAQRCVYKGVWVPRGKVNPDDLSFDTIKGMAVEGEPTEVRFTLINYTDNR